MSAVPSNTAANGLAIGYAMAALGAILFSSKAVMIKLAYGVDEVDAVTLLTLRMMFALPIYIVLGINVWKERVRKDLALPGGREYGAIALIGLLGYYLASYLDFVGLTYITAQFERLILFTYPFFVMIFGALFFGGAIKRHGLIALLVAYCGLAVIFARGLETDGMTTVIGALFVLAASASFALYQLLATERIKHVGSLLFTCMGMTAAGLGVFAHYMAVNGVLLPVVSQDIWIISVFLGVFATVLPSFLLNGALGRIGAQATSMIGTVSPVATIALAVVILGEAFTVYDAIGTALVILGVGYFTVKDRKA